MVASSGPLAVPPWSRIHCPSILQFSLSNYSVPEGGLATITVMRTGSIVGQVTVDYETSDGTAFAPTHYTAKTGTLTFTSGQSQTLRRGVTGTRLAVLNRSVSPRGGGALTSAPAVDQSPHC